MSDMVEKVARAIALEHLDPETRAAVAPNKWVVAESYLNLARAAIEAMREPTEEMLENTVDKRGSMRILEYTTPDERSQPFLMPRFTYRAMIDAALKE